MTSVSNPVEPGISRELARDRAAQVSDIHYRITIELEPGAARFRGTVAIQCSLRKTDRDLVLDFRDLDENGAIINGMIADLSVNAASVSNISQSNGHLIIPATLLKAGVNHLKMAFETGVAAAGRPITRVADRDDGSEYIYTLFVPMDASLAFPCFDQPDLKGRFVFEAIAPKAWTVIGNGQVESVDEPRAGYLRTKFVETQPISTYLFAFAAGPFVRLEGPDSKTPLTLYVRKSRERDAAREWSEVADLTASGVAHLEAYFAQPFPFSKYDQVLIPGFAYGGMEHAGATFLREDSILFRTTPTRADKLDRASLILHELSHQWFGDLVTMKWFDDLWLKEGFANYMASHAMDAYYRGPNYVDVWKRFYQVHKPAAYAIDSTLGTTPIFQEVRNLADAKSAYGAIVYQKAPSLLRALAFTIGDANFREGVRLFLKNHAYANAEWADLIKSFETSSGQKLEAWASAWIKQRGMPRVDVDWKCQDQGVLGEVKLRQSDVLGGGNRWPIKTRLLLAYAGAPAQQVTVELDQESVSIAELKGRKCPDYIFANDGDFAYGRFLLDERSRKSVAASLDSIDDAFLRAVLWGALWDGVRESEMPPLEYLSLAIRHLRTEGDEELAQSLLARVTTVFQRYISAAERSQTAAALEQVCLDRMQNAAAVGLRISFYRAFRALATTTAGRNQLKALLAGKVAVPGMELKPLDRWQTIRTLLGQGDPDAETLLAEEKVRDLTDEARKQTYLTEAARRDAATKQRYFSDYVGNKNVREDWIEASLASFNFWDQSEVTAPFLERSLQALPAVKRERKIFFVLAWLNAFIGGQRSPEALQAVNQFLKDAKLDPDLRLKVLEVTDELARTVRIRARK